MIPAEKTAYSNDYADSAEWAAWQEKWKTIRNNYEQIALTPDENIGQLSEREDSIRKSMEEAVIYKLKDTLDLWNLSRSPYISVQQYLKGSVPGVYVQETTGEPGSMQNMLSAKPGFLC